MVFSLSTVSAAQSFAFMQISRAGSWLGDFIHRYPNAAHLNPKTTGILAGYYHLARRVGIGVFAPGTKVGIVFPYYFIIRIKNTPLTTNRALLSTI